MTDLVLPTTDLARTQPAPLLRNLTLEISAKPMLDASDAAIARLVREVCLHWRSVAKHAERISILWWLSDGTDLLEYDGDPQRRIEWAQWLGFAHKTFPVAETDDPLRESLMAQPRQYHPSPPTFTYGDVARIAGIMRRTAAATLERPADIGVAFDPGTEFCRAPFRYHRHPELLITGSLKCIDCTARMHADPARFAGFPEGVPEGTTFGTFFGRQAHHYLRDMGFDFLWLSNSFGFGRSPYAFGGAGQFFDGERYKPEGNTEVRDGILAFWRDFRRECPGGRIECRGTDFTLGMNLVNHATPYQGIYDGGFGITPPPNTPWPYLTDNHGLAMAGWLSQLATWRGERLPYRLYAGDPWWCTSPWFDGYERQPIDILLNTQLTVVQDDGAVRAFDDIKILSVDTSWGEVPEELPDEIVPHLKRALRWRPDALPPLVLVHPTATYHRWAFDQPLRPQAVYAGDLFLHSMLGQAMPISSVVSDAALPGAAARLAGAILVSPVPEAGSAWETALLAHVDHGGALLLYGSLAEASAGLRQRLGVTLADPLDGALPVAIRDPLDTTGGTPALVLHHAPSLNDGGIREVADQALASVGTGSAQRAVVVGAGRIAWVRGSSSVTVAGVQTRALKPVHPAQGFPGEALARVALAHLGWRIAVERPAPDVRPMHLQWSRCRGALVLGASCRDAEAVLSLATPLGAPILPGRDTPVQGGTARIRPGPAVHESCRVFVTQASGTVGLHAAGTKHFRFRRRWQLTGLVDATVRFLPETGCTARTSILVNPNLHYYTLGQDVRIHEVDGPLGRHWELRGITGMVSIAWGRDDDPLPVPPPQDPA